MPALSTKTKHYYRERIRSILVRRQPYGQAATAVMLQERLGLENM